MDRFQAVATGAFAVCLLALLATLAGCTAPCVKPEPVVITKTVSVPAPYLPEPEERLKTCGHTAPGFRFYAVSPGSNDVVIRAEDQPAFRAWIDEKDRCIDAWRAGYDPRAPPL